MNTSPWGPWGWPQDLFTWTILLLGICSICGGAWALFARATKNGETTLRRQSTFSLEKHYRWLRILLSFLSALLSLDYLQRYLGNTPTIIDASSYWLEAKILAQGGATFSRQAAGALVQGRFMISPPSNPGAVGVIFPPGYPFLLAFFFLIGKPLLCGPFLGALTTWLTGSLAMSWTRSAATALLACLWSTICFALRYHTADTISHGLSIPLSIVLLLATTNICRRLAQECSFNRAERQKLGVLGLALGLSLGWLIATRPLTGIALGGACFLQIFWTSKNLKRTQKKQLLLSLLFPLGAGTLPGLFLLGW
ncbi:MAG: hypothetical protein MK135_17095, partial [Polyangiaceae bacterium]|nr:hypothetical protein [Polyangiaceae bacterium]